MCKLHEQIIVRIHLHFGFHTAGMDTFSHFSIIVTHPELITPCMPFVTRQTLQAHVYSEAVNKVQNTIPTAAFNIQTKSFQKQVTGLII